MMTTIIAVDNVVQRCDAPFHMGTINLVWIAQQGAILWEQQATVLC